MIETRDANTDDEAWMLEKLNQQGEDLDNFNPREFRLAVDEDTGERMAFGRTEFIRNVDDTEFVEINSLLFLEQSEYEHGCILLADLAEQATSNRRRQVFAFPYRYQDQFRDVGFNQVTKDQLPQVMQEKFDSRRDRFGDKVAAMTAEISSVEYEVEQEEEFQKPDQVTEEEVKQIKEDLGLQDEDTSTKYQV